MTKISRDKIWRISEIMGKKKKEFDEIVEKSLWEIITARMCRAISRRYLIKKTRQKIPLQYEKIQGAKKKTDPLTYFSMLSGFIHLLTPLSTSQIMIFNHF